MLRVCPLLTEGRCFAVENGTSIRTWRDPWVLGLPSFRPYPHPNLSIVDSASLVQSFIVPFTNLWNRNLIERTFDPYSAKKILQLHLPHSLEADKVFWESYSSGSFYVKSAYRLLLSARDPSLGPIPPVAWKQIWKLKMHERLKLFLWKVALNILPLEWK